MTDDSKLWSVWSRPCSPCVISLALITRPSVFRLTESVITAGDHPLAFTSISPVSARFPQRLSDSGLCSSPSNLCVRADDVAFGSCSFDNKSYSIVLPGLQEEESPEVGMQGELICDPAYRGSDGDSDGQQLLEHLLRTSALLPLMDTEMGYQVTKPDSVQIPHAGDSRRSSISSRSSTLGDSSSGLGLDRDAAKMEDSGKMVIFWDENLFCSGAPAGSNSHLPIDFSYQTFQSLVEPSDVLTLEKRRGEEKLNGHPDGPLMATSEHISHPVVSCCTDISASPTFQRPFFSLLSVNQSTSTIIVDSGYQSVVNTDAL